MLLNVTNYFNIHLFEMVRHIIISVHMKIFILYLRQVSYFDIWVWLAEQQ